MTLIKYNPLNDFIPSTFGGLVENMLNESPARERVFMPAVDVIREEKAIVLHVVAPGMSKENFSLDLKEDRLVITGERTLTKEARETYSTIESRFGKFRRVFKLNNEINTEKIGAKYENGILMITLPLEEKKESKKTIKIS